MVKYSWLRKTEVNSHHLEKANKNEHQEISFQGTILNQKQNHHILPSCGRNIDFSTFLCMIILNGDQMFAV